MERAADGKGFLTRIAQFVPKTKPKTKLALGEGAVIFSALQTSVLEQLT